MEQTTPKCFSVLIRQVKKRANQIHSQEKNVRHTNRKFRANVGKWNFKSIKAVIDLFGILLNQDLFLLMEDLKK